MRKLTLAALALLALPLCAAAQPASQPRIDGAPVRSSNPMPVYNSHTRLRAVTPADGADLTLGAARAIWVGGAGTIAIIAEGDSSAVTLSGVPAGTILWIRAKRILATGTSATLIVALY